MGLRTKILFILLLLFSSICGIHQDGYAQAATVRAVLFFSPTCNYCHQVIEEVLPPLTEQYGDQLEVIGIDVTTELGQALYQNAIARFQVPDERLGIPTMIVGNNVLWGFSEILALLPDLIQKGLQAGGIDWPDVPGLQKTLTSIGYNSGGGVIQNESTEPKKSTWKSNFVKDPVGNSVAVAVLLGMLASVIGVGQWFLNDSKSKFLNWPKWVLPFLVLVGVIIASYLSYIEITKVEAVCGPVGDCHSVQESQYAILFGVLPVGILGLGGYFAILIAWLMHNIGPEHLRKFFATAAWGMAWFGVIFSIYLTFLEPFVIGATCAWCISSAIVITLLLWITTGPALDAMRGDEYEISENDNEMTDAIEVNELQDQQDWESEVESPEEIRP